MLRISILFTFFLLIACDNKSSSIEQSAIPNEKLTGTWLYGEPLSEDTFHISANEDSIVLTRCWGKYADAYIIENDVLIKESGADYFSWRIEDENTLHRGNEQTAVKIDNGQYFDFGELSVQISEGVPTPIDTAFKTSEFCSRVYNGSIKVYAEDYDALYMELSVTSGNGILGTHTVEFGELSARVSWENRVTGLHNEWLESGTLECALTAEENLQCQINGLLILSGNLVVDFTINKKYLTTQLGQ